jgi:hypothetical protein
MSDGGLLMAGTDGPIDPTNPLHMARAQIIAQTLIDRAGNSPWGTPGD